MPRRQNQPEPYYHKPPMRFKDFEIHYNKDYTLKHIMRNQHDYYEFYFLVSGDVSYEVAGITYALNPGDILLIAPGLEHEAFIHASRTKPYERYVMWLSPDYLSRLSSARTDLLLPFQRSYLSGSRLPLAPDSSLKLSGLLDHILTSSRSQEYGADLMTNSYIIELLVQIARLKLFLQDYDFEKSFAPNQKNARLISDLLSYINGHITETLAVEQLASEFFISRSYLSKIFCEELGLPLHQFIMKKKLFLARQDLLHGLSVTDTCAKYHFGNYSSFFRAFKLEFGQSPRALLKGSGSSPAQS